MPKLSPLRLIKDATGFREWDGPEAIPRITRGIYVLYKIGKPTKGRKKRFDVFYIGVAGVGKDQRSGMATRLRNHAKSKPGWTHYSVFEVHDNITSSDIKELEGLILHIFRYDELVNLRNRQRRSKKLGSLSQERLAKRASKA